MISSAKAISSSNAGQLQLELSYRETCNATMSYRTEQGKRLVGVTEFSEEAKGIPCEAT